ncbi:hypothetical protein EAI_09417 [Harpegnathos saltator]|uniref:Mitochondrial splicing suppressor 51-like C-terminal domain-containing protein n=1 Tax=Harpegnathos saltator TaxID=610380 RepID=E2BQK0_HARSA|nr:hypothetical protein EAI_09417 [Harpegnathos saltator]
MPLDVCCQFFGNIPRGNRHLSLLLKQGAKSLDEEVEQVKSEYLKVIKRTEDDTVGARLRHICCEEESGLTHTLLTTLLRLDYCQQRRFATSSCEREVLYVIHPAEASDLNRLRRIRTKACDAMATRSEYQKRQVCHYDRMFFHPMVCHVCKWLKSETMISCDCNMISYCCRQHMAMNQEESNGNLGHRQICRVIQELVHERRMRTFYGKTLIEWTRHKRHYVNAVEKKLARELQPHEKQMLLFARACHICYIETDLTACPGCFSVDYCPAHRNFTEPHECAKLREWLHFEMQALNVNPVPIWRTFHDFPERINVYDMDSFYEAYMLPARNKTWTILDMVYSEYLSRPLTMYYSMQDAELLDIPKTKNTYVIHIIEASGIDKVNLPSWEIFLHAFQQPMKLIVIMVGVDLASDLAGRYGIVQTCSEKCATIGHKLYFRYYRMLYHLYAGSELYTKPDVIVGFQVAFNDGETLAQFLTSLKSPFCPVIFTSRSKANMRKLTNKLQAILTFRVKSVLNTQNGFRSHRPYRDHVTGRVFYRNECVIIFKQLGNLSSNED